MRRQTRESSGCGQTASPSGPVGREPAQPHPRYRRLESTLMMIPLMIQRPAGRGRFLRRKDRKRALRPCRRPSGDGIGRLSLAAISQRVRLSLGIEWAWRIKNSFADQARSYARDAFARRARDCACVRSADVPSPVPPSSAMTQASAPPRRADSSSPKHSTGFGTTEHEDRAEASRQFEPGRRGPRPSPPPKSVATQRT